MRKFYIISAVIALIAAATIITVTLIGGAKAEERQRHYEVCLVVTGAHAAPLDERPYLMAGCHLYADNQMG